MNRDSIPQRISRIEAVLLSMIEREVESHQPRGGDILIGPPWKAPAEYGPFLDSMLRMAEVRKHEEP